MVDISLMSSRGNAQDKKRHAVITKLLHNSTVPLDSHFYKRKYAPSTAELPVRFVDMNTAVYLAES